MKKIVFVTRSMKSGGAERVISQLTNRISTIGIKCYIITLNDCESFYKLNASVELIRIGTKSDNRLHDKLLKYIQLRKHIKIIKPDMVLALPEEIGIYVIPSLLGLKVPVVVSERNNPWIMPWKKSTRLLRKIVYPFAAGFIFQTNEAASFFSKNIRNKGIVLSNPLDLKRIPAPCTLKREKKIVGIGRLEEQKDFDLLIRAFEKVNKRHPEYKLVIYGEGSLEDHLKSLADTLLPKESYYFAGKSLNVLEEVKCSSIFVLSSKYEGMPNVLIEAMATGLPVIATDCPPGGPRKLINNENGLLIPVGNCEKLTSCINRLIEDEEFAKKISINALKIKRDFDETKVTDEWVRYFYTTYSNYYR